MNLAKNILVKSIKSDFETKKKGAKYILLVLVAVLLYLSFRKSKSKIQSKMAEAKIQRKCKPIPADQTIFISIISGYNEMDKTIKTIQDLYDKASCPFLISVGVYQIDTDQNIKYGGFKAKNFMARYRVITQRKHTMFEGNIRVLNELIEDSKGPANARHMIEKYLYKGEKYYMLLRNGVCLCDQWDEKVVSDLQRAKLRSPKPILTQYPSLVKGNQPMPLTFLGFQEWSEYGTPHFKATHYKNPPVRPFKSLFWTSCFSFTHASVMKEVPQDPWLQHLSLRVCDWTTAVRLWTSGWDFYTPTSSIVNMNHPTSLVRGKWDRSMIINRAEEDLALRRMWCLLQFPTFQYVDLKEYGLGQVRSLGYFKHWIGLDWNIAGVQPHVVVGMNLPLKPNAQFPFENEEIVAKYGSWTEFYDITKYRFDNNVTNDT